MAIYYINRKCPKCNNWLAVEVMQNDIKKIRCSDNVNCNYVEDSTLKENDIDKSLKDEIGYEPETLMNADRQDEEL